MIVNINVTNMLMISAIKVVAFDLNVPKKYPVSRKIDCVCDDNNESISVKWRIWV